MAGSVCISTADTQDADTLYFHPAASLYIRGDTLSASNLVERGLTEFPDDAKLQRLKDLLEQQQDQQNQDQQQDQMDQQREPQDAQQLRNPEEMTEEEARQLMDAMKQDEKNKRLLLHPVMGAPVRVEKDW